MQRVPNIKKHSAPLLILALLLASGLMLGQAGCTMAPNYERPDAPVPSEFPEYPEFKGVGSETDNKPVSATPYSASESGATTEQDKLYVQPRAEGEHLRNVEPQGEDLKNTPVIVVQSTHTQVTVVKDSVEGEEAAPVVIDQAAREKAWTGSSVPSAQETFAKNGEKKGRDTGSGPVQVDFDETPAPGNIAWREFFTDPGMQLVIALALENNRDLRSALLNIEKYRAMYEIQRADLLPSIQASGSNSNQRMPAEMTTFNQAYINRSTTATVGFTSYELDLFGRVRSLKDSALENYFAVTQNAHSAQVSLVAEVASTYLTLVSYKELYELTRETYESRKKSYEMSQVMFEGGVSSQMELNQARTSLEESRVAAAQYRTYMLRYENALVLLVGSPLPEDLAIPSRLADISSLKDVPENLPSDLIIRRPDILAAEHQLKSANANIGAARASFFPRISLTGNLGYLSLEMDGLFGNANRTWSFAPSVSIPIFEGGRLLANLRVSEVEKRMAVNTYESTIQTAFREVADALAFRSTAREQVDAATSLAQAARESLDLSNIRYDVGVDSFLNVLDSQRAYFGAQQSYVNTILAREINTLNLYKALGGGWE